ncbi:polar amino acid transport system permease protein [Pectinatus haikarae]|uniref:Polar amino acid transport system permease protein n=1 Tax=Pectinatus haikarae TaxID=349096 RepID=A0ABT9Y7J8_9FIRM|nr:polar amino acid transport system permease protein [Pectinatus haikarae]
MDLLFIQKFAPMYAKAAVITVQLACTGIVMAILTGLLVSIVRYRKIPVLSQLFFAYVQLFRNTPLLVQLFFLYFGLPKLGIHISGPACAIAGLTLLGGSYMAEAFRAGLSSVSKSQIEAAEALGFSHMQIMRYVIVPQALAVSIPPLCANVIFLIKETSVFSVVALSDLVYVAKDLIGLYYKTDEALLLLVISYLIILLPVSLLASLLERRIRYAGFGNTGIV